jgi:putative membrane protein
MTTTDLLGSCWRFDPIALAACAGAVFVQVRRRARLLPAGARAREACSAAGLLVLLLALVSPLGALANGYLFSAHMLQHLLLVLVVPPLLLLGLEGSSGGRARVPAVVPWGLGLGAMWLWHAPTLCNAASRAAPVHLLQEVSLLAMGSAFWWPIVSPRAGERLPPLGGVVYLFTGCVACTLLGIAITFSPVEVCSVFANPVDRLGVMPLLRDGWGLTPARDQQIGGLLMWVPACFVYLSAILAVLARLFHDADAGAGPSPAATDGPRTSEAS